MKAERIICATAAAAVVFFTCSEYVGCLLYERVSVAVFSSDTGGARTQAAAGIVVAAILLLYGWRADRTQESRAPSIGAAPLLAFVVLLVALQALVTGTGLSRLTRTVDSMASDVGSLSSDVSTMGSDIGSIQSDVSSISDASSSIQSSVENIEQR